MRYNRCVIVVLIRRFKLLQLMYLIRCKRMRETQLKLCYLER